MKKVFKVMALALVAVIICSVFAGCSIKLTQEQKLIGKWEGTSALGSSFTFKEDGSVDIVYVDFMIPILNQKFSGSVSGIYTTDKDENKNNTVTLNYTIMFQTIQKTYQFVVSDNILTLTDPDNGSQIVLSAAAEETT